MTAPRPSSPCPRCGSSDVVVQPRHGLRVVDRFAGSAAADGFSGPASIDGSASIVMVLFGALLDAIGWLGKRLGWTPKPPPNPPVHFCRDCGWSQDVA